MNVSYARHRLIFKMPSRTSRELLTYKDVWYILLNDTDSGRTGIGECAVFPGLSCDWSANYENKLIEICHRISNGNMPDLTDFPSIKFGIESAMSQLNNIKTRWHKGELSIIINGLVWIGTQDEMLHRVEEKLNLGFKCIKLKIGGIDFNRELEILAAIRSQYSRAQIELRLDANGAFQPHNALEKLDQLAKYDIHSIEQPIRQGQWQKMSEICKKSPIPIALDEELIGIKQRTQKEALLKAIHPQYIILKPTLCGGLSGSDEWIELARYYGINWWATSALESNVGLDAIANWVSDYNPEMPQGLGTGALYTNNIPSPLTLVGENLSYDANGCWDYSQLNWVKA